MTPATDKARAARPQLPALTSLRFVAAFWVLGHHAMPRAEGWLRWNAFWDVGWLGVTFFFVLSGFILTYTYGQHSAPIAVRPFWMARVARIVPMYFAAMLFAVPQFAHTVTHPAAGQAAPEASTIVGATVSSVLMLQAWFPSYACLWNCPSWSLSAEFFFYALFPWLVPLAMIRVGRGLLLATTLVCVSVIAAGYSGLTVSPVALAAAGATLNPLARLPEFMAGVWLGGAFLARDAAVAAGRGNRAGSTGGVSGIAAGGAALAIVAIAVFGRPALGAPLHLWALPFFAVVVYAAATLGRGRAGLFELAPFVLLGNASYALYMTHGSLHGYALAVANRVAPGASAATVFVAYLIAAVALAIGCYLVIERPARGWIQRRTAAIGLRSTARETV